MHMHTMNTTEQQKKMKCFHSHDNVDEFQMHYTEGKKPVSKATHCLIPFIYIPSWKRQNYRRNGQTHQGSPGAGTREALTQRGTGKCGGMMDPPHLDSGGGYMTVCVSQNSQNFTPKRVNAAVCKLHLKTGVGG